MSSRRIYLMRIVCGAPRCRETLDWQTAFEGVEAPALELAEAAGWTISVDAEERMTLTSDAHTTRITLPALCPACGVVGDYFAGLR